MRQGRALAFFAGVSGALILISTLVLRTFFRAADEQRAMLLSAGLAFAVQLGTYALVRPARGAYKPPGELLIRWSVGAVVRLLVLVMYAPLARVMFLPLDAALVSLVTFFFMTMMAEPLLLEYDR